MEVIVRDINSARPLCEAGLHGPKYAATALDLDAGASAVLRSITDRLVGISSSATRKSSDVFGQLSSGDAVGVDMRFTTPALTYHLAPLGDVDYVLSKTGKRRQAAGIGRAERLGQRLTWPAIATTGLIPAV